MGIMEAKLRYRDNGEFINRRRIDVWLSEQIKRHPVHILYGSSGLGKTSAVYHYVEKNFKQFGYLRLDSYDNHIEEFQAYFREMARRNGCSEPFPEGGSLIDTVRNYIIWSEKQDQKGVLIFDGIQHIEEEEIMEAFHQLILYGSASNIIFFLCDFELQDFWKKCIAEGTANMLYSEEIAFRESEVVSYCKKNKITLTEKSKNEIMRMTSGWPALLHLKKFSYDEYLEKNNKERTSSLPLRIKEYIYFNIWNYFTLDEKDLIAAISYLPYADDALLHEVPGIKEYSQEILWLRSQGIIQYDTILENYRVVDVIQVFLSIIKEKRPSLDGGIFENVLDWYEKNGRYREMYLFSCTMEHKEYILEIMKKYLPSLVRSLDYSQVRVGLDLISDRTHTEPRILYYLGIAGVYEEDYDRVDKVITSYKKMRQDPEEDHHMITELLLNLYYMDRRVDIDQWLDLAENHLAKDERICLYMVNGIGFSVCFGAKELTPFFRVDNKVQKQYQNRFFRIICQEQRDYFYAAEAEYCLVTKREKKTVQYIYDSLVTRSILKDRSLVLSLFALLCHLYSKDIVRDVYHSNYKTILAFIRKECDQSHFITALSYSEYFTNYQENREYIGRWIYHNAKKLSIHESAENVGLFRIHAKVLMVLNEKKRALGILQQLESFYSRIGTSYYLTETQFAQAVITFEMNKKAEALKIVSKAINQGMENHYVDLFTGYGKPGYDLLLMYKEFMSEGTLYGGNKKKKYFYGNILQATFEEYVSIVIREAKKSLKNDSFDADQPINRLTDMERLVVRLVERGFSNQEISEELNIKITTVKTHLTSIYRKLGVKNRQAALLKIREKM